MTTPQPQEPANDDTPVDTVETVPSLAAETASLLAEDADDSGPDIPS